MAATSVFGCDMCDAVSSDPRVFYRIGGYVEWHEGEERKRSGIGESDPVLCKTCIEPLLMFQASLKNKTANERLTKRVMTALEKNQ